MLVVPDVGTSWLLERLRSDFNAGPLKAHLYQNNVFPTLASDLPDFTESNFPGYGAKNVNFSLPVAFDPQGHGFLAADTITFVSTAAPPIDQPIVGYFITNAASDTLVWAERFDRRIRVNRANVTLALRLRFGSLSEWTG
jgi:hypothetical protein